MNRHELINTFVEWFHKPENIKHGYGKKVTFKNLNEWDKKFFDNQLFNITKPIREFSSKVKNLVYDEKNIEFRKMSIRMSKGVPLAVLGKENYIKFLDEMSQDRFPVGTAINYFSFKTTKDSIDTKSPDHIKEFVFDGISWHYDKTRENDLVFFVQHGDKPTWSAGLSAICKIIKGPYDKGYYKTNYRVKLKPLLILPRVLNRKEFIGYFNCYDLTNIGPATHGEPNQANNILTELEAKNLTGALIDILPEIRQDIYDIFGFDFPNKVQKVNHDISNSHKTNNDWSSKVSKNRSIEYPRNLIIYGAPGTGKSYELNSRKDKCFPHVELYSRITFHPNYSYRDFLGSYVPKPLYKETNTPIFQADGITPSINNREPLIEYTFEPGAFLKMYIKAIKNPEHNFLILIEELNRAPSATVFGDLFQLLDRDKDGVSEYSIQLIPSAREYLRRIGIPNQSIKIPSNLYIWATMNNADQGVLPLDTAFKRRWCFEHISLNNSESTKNGVCIDLPFLHGRKLEWNSFRKKINTRLIEFGIHEDKLIGPFFLSNKEIEDSLSIKSKLLLYLNEDVLRYKSGLFSPELKNFSDIAESFDKKNNVFDPNIDWFE